MRGRKLPGDAGIPVALRAERQWKRPHERGSGGDGFPHQLTMLDGRSDLEAVPGMRGAAIDRDKTHAEAVEAGEG